MNHLETGHGIPVPKLLGGKFFTWRMNLGSPEYQEETKDDQHTERHKTIICLKIFKHIFVFFLRCYSFLFDSFCHPIFHAMRAGVFKHNLFSHIWDDPNALLFVSP